MATMRKPQRLERLRIAKLIQQSSSSSFIIIAPTMNPHHEPPKVSNHGEPKFRASSIDTSTIAHSRNLNHVPVQS
ncbi:hypothetical protein LR48_Vigan08g157600 [Vigna angularis]|uniref:Uncharacterized protein n=2 Tax=Phaseolus angularis TaxID=3914 RepID=A0A0L9V7U0_PHAAN|nr:hypothetical protein LR48_Vigan08g157600 [Vigna angularis]BAT90653.1 hypothetical protein VIGAN_06192900 [Vigna angularis var. angularis]